MTKEELERIKQRTNDGYTTFPEVRELIAEIERLQSEREWRDISTAPKDGTSVLGFREGYERKMVWWYWNDAWRCDASYHTNGLNPPTHWMPLPSAPEGGKE